MGLHLNSEERRYQSERIWPRDVVDATNAEMARFVRIAMGSASELDHHLLLCKDLGYLENDHYRRVGNDLTEVRKMLSSLLVSIENELGTATQTVAKGRALSAKG